MTLRLPTLLLLTAFLAVSPAPLGAAPKKPPAPAAAGPTLEAQRLKEEGDRAMSELRYMDALELYRRAEALERSPVLLYNQGRALEGLARYPEALDFLERFAAEAPEDLRARLPGLDDHLQKLREKVGELVISANVVGARVLVRGNVVGTTPLEGSLRLNAGPAEVEVEAEGYHPYRARVEVRGSGRATVRAVLRKKVTKGVARIDSPVAGARVRVDGRVVGTVPVEIALERGAHRVEVFKEGYETATTRLVVAPDERKQVSVPLVELPGLLSKWYFWAGAGTLAAAAAVTTVALLTEREAGKGDIPPGRISGPLLRF